MTSLGTRGWWLLTVALVLAVGCGSPPEESPTELPGTAAAPEVAETPAATAPVEDPAVAARVEMIRGLIEEGLDVNLTDPDGRTALMMAAFDGYTEVIELLLEHGAEVNRSDRTGRTALMYASSGPFPQTVELLVESGADVNRADTVEGWTALMFAAAEGQQAVVEVLLKHGADLEITDQDGDAAVDHARERGETQVVALLEAWTSAAAIWAPSNSRSRVA